MSDPRQRINPNPNNMTVLVPAPPDRVRRRPNYPDTLPKFDPVRSGQPRAITRPNTTTVDPAAVAHRRAHGGEALIRASRRGPKRNDGIPGKPDGNMRNVTVNVPTATAVELRRRAAEQQTTHADIVFQALRANYKKVAAEALAKADTSRFATPPIPRYRRNLDKPTNVTIHLTPDHARLLADAAKEANLTLSDLVTRVLAG